MKAWHFARQDERTRYTNEPIVVGEALYATGPLSLCENGLHGSLRIIDALAYANGCILYEVNIEGDILIEKDKICGRKRTAIAKYDFRDALVKFARFCADEAKRYTTSKFGNRAIICADYAAEYASGAGCNDCLYAFNAARFAAAAASFYAAASVHTDTAAHSAEEAEERKQERWLQKVVLDMNNV